MKKIPTVFERDWNGDRSRVIDKVNAGCEWVLAGEGVATRKLDGTCCMIRDGKLYKRREIKAGQEIPPGFESVGTDEETGKTVGWVPVGDGPEDTYHREGLANISGEVVDGTYELLGPKVQGNREIVPIHSLLPHANAKHLPEAPRTFDGLQGWLAHQDIEGVVFHHPDGRMAKIKGRDFRFKRPLQKEPQNER